MKAPSVALPPARYASTTPTALSQVALPAPELILEEVRRHRDTLRSGWLPRSRLSLFWDVVTCDWRLALGEHSLEPTKSELIARGALSRSSNAHKVTQRLLSELHTQLKAFFDRRKELEKNPKSMLLSEEQLSLRAAQKRPGRGKSPKICQEFLPPSEELRKLLSKILKDDRLRYAGAPEILARRPNAPTPMVAALDLTTRQLYITTDWQWQARQAAKDFEPKFLTHKFYLSQGQILARLAPTIRMGLCEGLKQYQKQIKSGQAPIGYDHYGHVSYLFDEISKYRSESTFIPMEEL